MSSTSVRVPGTLLEALHRARVPGVSLAEVIETALERAGGAEAIGRALKAKRRRDRAQAQVARLRRIGHRSVVLDPGEQIALAEGIRRKVELERERGDRRIDPETGTLILTGQGRTDGHPGQAPSRRGPMLGERRSGGAP